MIAGRLSWTPAEEAYLQDAAAKRSRVEIAARLGRPIEGVRAKARRLGLQSDSRCPVWPSKRRRAFLAAYAVDPARAAVVFEITRDTARRYWNRWRVSPAAVESV